MEPLGLLPYSQEWNTGSFSEPDNSSSHCYTQILQELFECNIKCFPPNCTTQNYFFIFQEACSKNSINPEMNQSEAGPEIAVDAQLQGGDGKMQLFDAETSLSIMSYFG